MLRMIRVFALGCLFLMAGLLVLSFAIWAIAASGHAGAAEVVLTYGLAILIPTTFLIAGIVIPRKAGYPGGGTSDPMDAFWFAQDMVGMTSNDHAAPADGGCPPDCG